MGSHCGCCSEYDASAALQYDMGINKKVGLSEEHLAPDADSSTVLFKQPELEDGWSVPEKLGTSFRIRGRRGRNARIGTGTESRSSHAEPSENRLEGFRRPRHKGNDTKELIRVAMKKDPACALLQNAQIDAILGTMEYYVIQAGQTVVDSGDTGTKFFVTHTGTLEVRVNDNVISTKSCGDTFGGIALLCKHRRTETVIAKTECAVFGANGEALHRILKENSQKSYSENRHYLNAVGLFDSFSDKQKDRIGAAFFIEVYKAGARVVTAGEIANAMFFVKKGSLKVIEGGTISIRSTVNEGGTVIRTLDEADIFGEDSFLERGIQTHTVVATSTCELLCISGDKLRDELGQDLKECLEHNFILNILKKSPVYSQLSENQQHDLARAVSVKEFDETARIPDRLVFAVLCFGTIDGKSKDQPVTLERGAWWEHKTLYSLQSREKASKRQRRQSKKILQILDTTEQGGLSDLVAGSGGARIAFLTEDDHDPVMKGLGLTNLKTAGQAADYTRKLILLKRVPIFRHIAPRTLDSLVHALEQEKFSKDSVLIKQGKSGSKLFIITDGAVSMSRDGVQVGQLAKNNSYGERALLFCEPSEYTVQVSTIDVEIWSLPLFKFNKIIDGRLMEVMKTQLQLQCTDVNLQDLKSLKLIGSGSSAAVWLMEHSQNQTRYALKRVRKRKHKVPVALVRETELLGENNHPFIMRLVNTYETEQNVYMLTELITGGELHAAIRSIPSTLTRSQTQFYIGSLVLVLEELLQRNIVYRDLKPENVMLDHQGYLKLIDFGIAKKFEENQSKTFTMIGTPHYMAPEALLGVGYGSEVDLWALGIMAFELTCGYMPFADETDDPLLICNAICEEPLAFPDDYKDDCGKDLIAGLLRRDPAKRLGAGMFGFEDIRNVEFFKANQKGSFFGKLQNRELEPPILPAGEQYAPPELLQQIDIADLEELKDALPFNTSSGYVSHRSGTSSRQVSVDSSLGDG